jgi:hypothetical protein
MNFNFLEFLKTLDGMDQAEIILTARRERERARVFKVKSGKAHKDTRLKQGYYITDLGDFLHFVGHGDNSGKPWPEAFLASPEWKNTQRFRYGGLLGDSE